MVNDGYAEFAMTYEPKNLKRWTLPPNYFGEIWPAYFSASVGQSRDSDALEQSNFDCMLANLGGESDTVVVVRETHWRLGWVEWIAIHEDDEKALRRADEVAGKLKSYPIMDDNHHRMVSRTKPA